MRRALRKRGALLAAEDFVLSLILLVIFFVIVMNLVEGRRDAQRREIVMATMEMESSSTLVSLMRMPYQDRTVGNVLVEALYEGNNPFEAELAQKLRSYLDAQFDAGKVSWEFRVQPTDPDKYSVYLLRGTNGDVCDRGRRQVAGVSLPVLDSSGSSLYSATLWRCFIDERSWQEAIASSIGGWF